MKALVYLPVCVFSPKQKQQSSGEHSESSSNEEEEEEQEEEVERKKSVSPQSTTQCNTSSAADLTHPRQLLGHHNKPRQRSELVSCLCFVLFFCFLSTAQVEQQLL